MRWPRLLNPRLCVLSALVVSAPGTIVPAAETDPRSLIANANQAYERGDYQAALDGYNEAEVALPESPEIAYNQGLAHYKLGDLVAARNHFNRALLTRDLNLEANVKYNLGNVDYAGALEKQADPQEAIDLLKSAIGHYRDALALRPGDADALANIQSAQLLIKKLLDDLKKKQEQQKKDNSQDQNQNQEQSQDQEQNQQDSQQQNQPDQDQENHKNQKGQNDTQQENQQQNGQPKQDQAGQDKQSGDQPQSAQKSEPREMTQQEAERLLQAVRDKERKRKLQKNRRMHLRRLPVVKDW